MKKHLMRAFLFLVSLALAIALVESYLRVFGKDRFDIAMHLKRPSQFEDLRVHFEKKAHHKFDFIHEGKLIYRQEIETDEWGRRKTYGPSFSKTLIMFFGCSYTFGSGLQQHETLPYQFSKTTQIDSLNYALPAYGPHGLLRQAEVLPFGEQISSTYSSVYAAYIFYGFQWRRATGGIGWIAKMGGNHPFYKLDSKTNTISYQGRFSDAQPIKMWFIKSFNKFHLLHYLPQIWDHESATKADQLLFCGMMNKTQELLRKKIGSPFKGLKIIHPYFDHDKLWNEFLLGARKCFSSEVELVEFKMPGSREKWAIDSVLEDHPNIHFNKLLSDLLARRWQEQLEK